VVVRVGTGQNKVNVLFFVFGFLVVNVDAPNN
jgi:hypothetical protein